MTEKSLGSWHEIADRVWTLVAQPESVTVGLVAGSSGLLVVDPGSSPTQGRAIRESATRLTGLPVIGAVATHVHHDHAFGLAAFDDLTTWGHESLLEDLTAAPTTAAARSLGLDPTVLRPPNRPFAVAAGVDLGGRWVEMAHLGEGHTAGDSIVVVSDAQLVFVGDLLESSIGNDAPGSMAGEHEPAAPWYGEDSAPEAWPATLDAVIGLLANGRVQAIPGHGPAMGFEDALRQRGQIAAVAGEIERLLRAGVAVEDALGQGTWPFPDAHVAAGVRAGYRRLTAAGVRPDRTLPIV